MNKPHIPKPITGQRPALAKIAERLLWDQLPIHKWEAEQREARKRIKL